MGNPRPGKGFLVSKYSDEFYSTRRAHTLASAMTVLSAVRASFHFDSVVDLGCGTGTWLAAAAELGASRLRGLEGNWVTRDMLDAPAIELNNLDLSRPIPVEAIGRFDLAICLEVAEHLPPHRADGVVDELCSMSDVVLFGAAVPGQRGVGHVNEQWQTYWQVRFADRGYSPNDLRPLFWSDEQVLPHYAQNSFVYTKGGPVLAPSGFPVNIVHPGVLQQYEHPSVKLLLKLNAEFPRATARAIARRLPKPSASRTE